MQKKSNRGMTLIELMLVIGVASMLLVVSLNTFRGKAMDNKAEKVVLELQQWIQAAISYQISGQTLPSSSDIKSLLVKEGFMPNSAQDNPWGHPYNLSINANMIHVDTSVPQGIANIIQGRLPLSQTAKSFNGNAEQTVTMEIPLPQISDPLSVQYVDILSGTRKNPAIVDFPQCPANTKPEIFVAPVTFSSGQEAYPIVQVGAYAEPMPDNVPKWKVYSSLYTVKGSAEDNTDFTTYNNFLVMTKCTKLESHLTVTAPQLEKFPILFK